MIQILVPFIAYIIVNGGKRVLSHLASNIMLNAYGTSQGHNHQVVNTDIRVENIQQDNGFAAFPNSRHTQLSNDNYHVDSTTEKVTQYKGK